MKSNDRMSDFVKGHASRPYNNCGNTPIMNYNGQACACIALLVSMTLGDLESAFLLSYLCECLRQALG